MSAVVQNEGEGPFLSGGSHSRDYQSGKKKEAVFLDMVSCVLSCAIVIEESLLARDEQLRLILA